MQKKNHYEKQQYNNFTHITIPY